MIFPDYGTSGQFKIVKTVWDVLMDRYTEMELGTLSTSLSEALGISSNVHSGGAGGGAGSEYRTLLWTNPSPTSSFAAQTVSIDVADYDAVSVEFSGEASHTTMCERGISYYTLRPAYAAIPSYRASSLPATNGVYFDDCRKNSGSTIDNTQLVPYKIYGIKYERVAPPQLEVPQKTELLRVSSGLANTDYTLADNISNYDIISFVGLSSYSNRWGTMIPTSVFTETTNNYHFYLGTEPNVYNFSLHYTNDTTITVGGHGTGTIGLVIIGMQL